MDLVLTAVVTRWRGAVKERMLCLTVACCQSTLFFSFILLSNTCSFMKDKRGKGVVKDKRTGKNGLEFIIGRRDYSDSAEFSNVL
jgi:hypothetical protein